MYDVDFHHVLFIHSQIVHCRATSATDQHKYQYTPLQDNVEIALLWTFRRFPWLRSAILGWRVDMHW